jgi:hypothetical protein
VVQAPRLPKHCGAGGSPAENGDAARYPPTISSSPLQRFQPFKISLGAELSQKRRILTLGSAKLQNGAQNSRFAQSET